MQRFLLMKQFNLLIILSFTLLISCGGGKDAKQVEVAPPPFTEEEKNMAIEIFTSRCSVCHGVNGDGVGATKTSPPPRAFTDSEWQAGIDDAGIARIIKYGGLAVGKSATMPGNPDLVEKEGVINALVFHIRSLKKVEQ